MEQIGLSHRPKRKPNGITKADRKARKSDNLLKRDFTSAEPLKKCVTDMTEIKAKDGKLYVSAIFDCFDAAVLGLSFILTGVRSTPVEATAGGLQNMAFSRACTVKGDAAMTMRSVRA